MQDLPFVPKMFHGVTEARNGIGAGYGAEWLAR
jgi:hypothetical protein